jgi:hypothetical protein
MSLFSKFLRKKLPLAEQIRIVRECGLEPNPGINLTEAIAGFAESAYEDDPFRLLLVMMGSETEDKSHRQICDSLWHLDTECIEGPGDYVRVAERMTALTRGDLRLERINDHVDLENEEAWVSFSLDGKEMKWHANIDDDWIDAGILSLFAELLATRKTEKRYTYLDLGGQDCLIGCATPEQLAKINNATRLNFTWLK